jgi:hypothetical protein
MGSLPPRRLRCQPSLQTTALITRLRSREMEPCLLVFFRPPHRPLETSLSRIQVPFPIATRVQRRTSHMVTSEQMEWRPRLIQFLPMDGARTNPVSRLTL